ncbi:MAG: LPS export ABC transporter periplasmic protein LptC [Nitrospirota bacterium]
MKRVLLIGLFLLVFSALFLAVRTGRETNGNLNLRGKSFLENVKIIHREDGETLWILTARKAEFMQHENKAELSGVSLSIPENSVTLYADKGAYNISERNFTTDEIVTAKAAGYRITADSIDYEISSGKVKTGGRIKIEAKGFEVEGVGMSADSEEKVSILNDVKAIFHK